MTAEPARQSGSQHCGVKGRLPDTSAALYAPTSPEGRIASGSRQWGMERESFMCCAMANQQQPTFEAGATIPSFPHSLTLHGAS